VGTAAKADGTYEMFLLSYTADKIFNPSPILTPVPESETYAMLLAGLGIIGLMKRRQRKLRAAV